MPSGYPRAVSAGLESDGPPRRGRISRLKRKAVSAHKAACHHVSTRSSSAKPPIAMCTSWRWDSENAAGGIGLCPWVDIGSQPGHDARDAFLEGGDTVAQIGRRQVAREHPVAIEDLERAQRQPGRNPEKPCPDLVAE